MRKFYIGIGDMDDHHCVLALFTMVTLHEIKIIKEPIRKSISESANQILEFDWSQLYTQRGQKTDSFSLVKEPVI